MVRSEPSWPRPGSWQCYCITCGRAETCTNRCTTAVPCPVQRLRKTNRKSKVKIVPRREKTKAQSRVPVTASMAWPRFHSQRAEPQGAKQMAAPAEWTTPNMHRAKPIAPRECGWKHGDSGERARKKKLV